MAAMKSIDQQAVFKTARGIVIDQKITLFSLWLAIRLLSILLYFFLSFFYCFRWFIHYF